MGLNARDIGADDDHRSRRQMHHDAAHALTQIAGRLGKVLPGVAGRVRQRANVSDRIIRREGEPLLPTGIGCQAMQNGFGRIAVKHAGLESTDVARQTGFYRARFW